MMHVTSWYNRISKLPSFVKHCGHTKMTELCMKPFDPNAKPVSTPKPQEAKKDDCEMDDLFGDDDDEDEEQIKKIALEAKNKAA